MRIFIKKKLKRLLETMEEMHKYIIAAKTSQLRNEYLQDCQEAALAVGNIVEDNVQNPGEIISLLEQYCEDLYLISVGHWKTDRTEFLSQLLVRVRQLLNKIESSYLVVFMPYKAEMWDSMESIWKTCMEDKRCECRVMPLPYYEYDSVKREWKPCYDGGRFSEEVQVTDYRNYSLDNVQPDVAYIHNPYDGNNFVTSVAPDYYSCQLKKKVGLLVYVPYYVTSGYFTQWNLPAYKHMDYMVVQSDYVKERCRGMYYYDKLLPFGSPKLDRIIEHNKSGGRPLSQWRPLLDGRKAVMLNTSIGSFLTDGEYMLRKLKYIFQIFRSRKQIAIIWRPHPLLEATIRSMRSGLAEEYRGLVQEFENSGIGILDKTPDVTNTVALCDGYIGEDSSSVVNLFLAVGKPVFILNNYITDSFTREEKRRFYIADILKWGDRFWMTSGSYNALLWMDQKYDAIHMAGRLEGQPRWQCAYSFLAVRDDILYLSPMMASQPVSYDIMSSQQKPLHYGQSDGPLSCHRVVSFDDKVFYISFKKREILEYNIRNKTWKSHSECITGLIRGIKDRNLAGQEERGEIGIIYDAQVSGNDLWITSLITNRILCFSMCDGTYTLYDVGEDTNGYSGIIVDGDTVWLGEAHSGDLIRWNRSAGNISSFHISSTVSWRKRRDGAQMHEIGIIDMGRWIIAGHFFSDSLIKFDKLTGDTIRLAEDFLSDADQAANGYCPEAHANCSFVKKIDDSSVLVQRYRDGGAAVINIEDGTYNFFYPTLSEEDYEGFLKDQDGFEKTERQYGFFCWESRIFSLEGFIDALYENKLEGVRERQMMELETMAANLDGTCGEKVHTFIMDVLKKEEQ